MEKERRLPAVSDVMFETMLNNESRKQYVSYLLCLVLKMDYDEIYNGIEFIKAQHDKDNYYDPKRTVDLACKLNGEILNVEMNNNMNASSLERNISYIEKFYSGSMKRGDDTYFYNKVIQININNFNFEGNEKEIDEFYIRNNTDEILTDKIRIIYIYLPLIQKKLYNKDKLTVLERLLLIFNEKANSELDKLIKGDKIMEEYRKDVYDASQDSEVLGLYDKEKEDERLKMIDIAVATEKGKEEGLREGKEEGRVEATLENAKNLLLNGVSDDLILKSLKISIEELENIKKELDN